jgi:hypothetical protein
MKITIKDITEDPNFIKLVPNQLIDSYGEKIYKVLSQFNIRKESIKYNDINIIFSMKLSFKDIDDNRYAFSFTAEKEAATLIAYILNDTTNRVDIIAKLHCLKLPEYQISKVFPLLIKKLEGEISMDELISSMNTRLVE